MEQNSPKICLVRSPIIEHYGSVIITIWRVKALYLKGFSLLSPYVIDLEYLEKILLLLSEVTVQKAILETVLYL